MRNYQQYQLSGFLTGIAWALLLLCLLGVMAKGLLSPELEGIDGAHHVMDGIFFRDWFRDFPASASINYAFNYYKQYPALGFIFWPPFFPLIEGMVFLVGGDSLLVAQLSILLFAGLLVFCFYSLMLRLFRPLAAFSITLLLITSPGLYQYFNVVMLEVPTLAMMALSTLLYHQLLGRSDVEKNYKRWLSLSFVAAMMLYTKQTAFILLFAFVIDLALNHPRLFKSQALWLALGAFVLLMLPLVVFTLKFGKANIEQSVGNNTNLIMPDFEGMRRWSLENWLYYFKVLPSTLGLPLLCLAAFECIRSLLNKSILRRNALWLAWLLIFYLFFSYFDNKSERFATLVIIPLLVLANSFVWTVWQTQLPRDGLIRGALMLVLIVLSVSNLWSKKIETLHGIHAISKQLNFANLDGNILYLGLYRQPFIYDIRIQDQQRKHFVLKGDDVFNLLRPVAEEIFDYRVRYILVEIDNLKPHEQQVYASLQKETGLKSVYSGQFYDQTKAYQLLVLENTRPISEHMHEIALSSKLIN